MGSQGVKRSFSPKMLFLLQITWYGHVTHAYSSARYPLQKLSVQKIIRGHLGSQGSKGHFHQKCYFSYMLHGMVMWLIHIHQLDTLYYVMGSNVNLGSFGVTGVKGHFHQKCYLTRSVLNSMTIRLKHMHQLETLYICYRVKGQLGSFGVHQKRAGYVSLLHTTYCLVSLLLSTCQYLRHATFDIDQTWL